jgi:hypothetical protein
MIFAEAIWEEAPPDVVQIGDVVTVVTDPAMVTDRPIKITFSEPVAEADPSHAFPGRREESAGST